MKKRSRLVPLILFFLTAGFFGLGQFKPEDVAQRELWEEFLATAEIVKAEPVGEGVTNPWRLTLKKGDVVHLAAWKNPDTKPPEKFLDNWRFEIAAYRLDKLLGLNMIPPAVEREFKKPKARKAEKGVISLWAENKTNLLNLMEKGELPPLNTDDMKYITRLWDCLIANEDRTQQNVLFTEDWRTILIDHSRAFRSSKKFTDQLVFGANGIQKLADGRPMLFKRIPRALLEKIKALDFDGIKKAVGPYLAENDIQAILARQKLILAEIAEMIKQNGEDNVLY